MMRCLQGSLVILMLVTGAAARGQQAMPVKKAPIKLFRPTTYLGNSDRSGGMIAKSTFDELAKKGISCHDSLGKQYKVLGFDFMYAERNLYEDSVGNLMVQPEYMTSHCFGDTLSAGIATTIYERTKAGDTAFFDNVLIVRYKKDNTPMPDSSAFLSRGMKFIITK